MPQDTIVQAILVVLGLDVVAGALLMLLGHYHYGDPALVNLGAGLGLVGGVLYLLFRAWGRRRARQGAGPHDRGGR